MAEFFTEDEVAVIKAFLALEHVVATRAMVAGYMGDGSTAMAYGAMVERLTATTTEARRLFSLAAIRLDCERSWEVIREEERRTQQLLAEMGEGL